MLEKDKPMIYLDTHAGRGLYDLNDAHALKTQEAEMGIKRLWRLKAQLSPLFAPYLEMIESLNSGPELVYYPGSPMIAAKRLRPTDKLFLSELHPQEFELLQQNMRNFSGAHCIQRDGYAEMLAKLPPPQRRGLIFIDPSYEVKTEYKTMTQALNAAFRQFATGVYCIWYPLIDNKLHQQLLRGFESLSSKNQLRAEFYLHADYRQGLRGYGIYLINPPFTLKPQLKLIFETLGQLFYPKSTYLID